jgi:hypothetical protein
MNLTVEIQADDIQKAIARALTNGPSVMSPSPLMTALAKAMHENLAKMEDWVRQQLAAVMADPEFSSKFRCEIKTAMYAEAQSMGRTAARAAVNAKE